MLRGKTIYIGRTSTDSTLTVSVTTGKGLKSTHLGAPNSVPNSVSRSNPAQQSAHCRIDVDQTGKMTLTNLKDLNVTFVNGMQVMSKRVDATSRLEMGQDRYSIGVNQIIEAASKIVEMTSPKPPKCYSLNHLQYVWDGYQQEQMKLRNHQKNVGLLSRIPMFFTMGSGALSAVAKSKEGEWPEWVFTLCIILTIMGLILMIIGFIISAQDKTIVKQQQLSDYFQDTYVCPNPECGRFMGNLNYKHVKKMKKCPSCQCQYTSE